MLLEPSLLPLLEFCLLVWAIPVPGAPSPGFWLEPVPEISAFCWIDVFVLLSSA